MEAQKKVLLPNVSVPISANNKFKTTTKIPSAFEKNISYGPNKKEHKTKQKTIFSAHYFVKLTCIGSQKFTQFRLSLNVA